MGIRGLGSRTSTALVISECQNGMTNPEYATNAPLVEQVTRRRMIENIALLSSALREIGIPIVHVTVQAYDGFRGWSANSLLTGVFTKRPLTVGDPSVEIHPMLTPDPRDFVIARHRGITSFHGTELEFLLRNLGIESIVLTGVSVNVAITGSAIEAVNRGFQVVVPSDCVAGATNETHDFMLSNIVRLLATVTTSEQIMQELTTEPADISVPTES
ncbi:MAG: cysteine hydrolase [Rhodococcus fascians]